VSTEEEIVRIRRSMDRWGYAHLDKRETVSDELARANGWLVLRGRTLLDMVFPDTPENRQRKKAYDSGDWEFFRLRNKR
jgi:hypothetical protein